jgi:integrase/recombinase XerD
MSVIWFRYKSNRDCLQRSWLKESIEGCWGELTGRGYTRTRRCAYVRTWLMFGEFIATKGDCHLDHLHQWVEPFLAQLPIRKERISNYRSFLRALIRFLVRSGALPPLPPRPPRHVHSHAELLDVYAQFLAEHRGITPKSIATIRRRCDELLAHLHDTCGTILADVTPEAIRRFLTLQAQRYHRITMVSICSMVRGFLIWLHGRGAMPRDLSGVVLAPRVFRHERCPRYLTSSQVQAVLSAIDRNTPVGRRDYAMLLLLATYGLRGCEVVRLRLDDIAWSQKTLHIRKRKTGNSSIYPLADSAAQAIIAYLREGRPASPHREVFLKLRPPHAPLGRRFDRQICKYLGQAGIVIASPGTHTFRYSCAQRLFAQGMTLKSIGDYLGHGSLDSTLRYTKIDVDQLRAVACNIGEDLL